MKQLLVITALLYAFLLLNNAESCPTFYANDLLQTGNYNEIQEKTLFSEVQ
jgi:hypothetical protein